MRGWESAGGEGKGRAGSRGEGERRGGEGRGRGEEGKRRGGERKGGEGEVRGRGEGKGADSMHGCVHPHAPTHIHIAYTC